MTTSRFLQIHTLTSYPASLLNRDDVGFAKRVPFGGAVRTRVSSQCLKRHWRMFRGEHSLGAIQVDGTDAPMSVRSRLTFEREIRRPLEASGVPGTLAHAVTEALMTELLGKSEKAKKKDEGDAGTKRGKGKKLPEGEMAKEGEAAEKAAAAPTERELRTEQVTVLGRPEIDFLLGEARAIVAAAKDVDGVRRACTDYFTKQRRENLKALRLASGLDAALFGRMVTSDILSRGDAAIHVAHAMTVHAEETETDYFSAVDDLLATGPDREMGSGHIGTTELTSGMFYGYVVIDVPLLVSNLEGCARGDWTKADRSLAAKVVESLVHMVATVSPGAKLGSTAPYANAHLVLAELGNSQPRTLANAFLRPVLPRPDLPANTYGALAGHLSDLDEMYGRSTERGVAAIGPADVLASAGLERMSLAALAAWSSSRIAGGA